MADKLGTVDFNIRLIALGLKFDFGQINSLILTCAYDPSNVLFRERPARCLIIYWTNSVTSFLSNKQDGG